jgi:hypothetical protein
MTGFSGFGSLGSCEKDHGKERWDNIVSSFVDFAENPVTQLVDIASIQRPG